LVAAPHLVTDFKCGCCGHLVNLHPNQNLTSAGNVAV
jgi:hypothetical protein